MSHIRIGIFGLKRGSSFIHHFLANNADVVAVCDKNPQKLNMISEKLGSSVGAYLDFDDFIEHPMDAVYIANYFHEHTPFAIKCLEKNIHVLCECTSNSTMAEGVALVRAAEKSKAFFMLAENYPFMSFNREMKRVYEEGTLGKVLFAEGEYNHPFNPYSAKEMYLYDSENHWRNYLPRAYYITHSLGPLMYATGSKPVRVTAMPVFSPLPPDCLKTGYSGDKAAIITCLNDDKSVFRVTGCAGFGAEENSYRICGEKGQIENIRGTESMINLNYNQWDVPEGREVHTCYQCEIKDKDEKLIKKAGHGGGDFIVVREFLNHIRSGTRPEMDEYFATRLASVAIMAHRSILDGGNAYDIPDFKNKEDRIKFENDNLSPFWYSDGTAPSIRPGSDPKYKPSKEQNENFKKALDEYKNKI